MSVDDKTLLERKAFLRPDEAARLLGCSTRTVYRLIKAGVLESVTAGLRRGLRVRATSLKTMGR